MPFQVWKSECIRGMCRGVVYVYALSGLPPFSFLRISMLIEQLLKVWLKNCDVEVQDRVRYCGGLFLY